MYNFIRILASTPVPNIPGFSGFVSMMGESPEKLTTIEFYLPIQKQKPITEKSTVQEVLHYSEVASGEVGQDRHHNL